MLYPSQTIPSADSLSSKLEELKRKVFEKRPTLGKLFEDYGETTIANFIPYQYMFPKNNALPQERKQELITSISKNVEKKLGKKIADSVAQQLQDHYFISTAFHHGPITYPGYTASNLLTSLYREHLHSPSYENIILLSCANISFDNNYNFSRGLSLHDVVNGQEFSNQLVFFPRKVRPYPIVYHPAFTKDSLIEAYGRIDAWTNKEFAIKKPNGEKLKSLVEEICDTDFVLSEKTYSDQVTKINFLLWKKLFPAIHMVDLEQEEIVIELLLSFHMQQDTLIHRLLFSSEYNEQIIKYFEGIPSAFSIATQTNSFLFWAFPNNQRSRVQLWKHGDKLVTPDETYSIELSPEAIAEAFRKQEIIPSTLLSFMTLAFYYGLDLLGGMSQTSYMPKMQEAYIKLLEEIGEPEDIPIIQGLDSTHQNFTRCDLAFIDTSLDKRITASSIDLLLYTNNNFLAPIAEMTQSVTIEQLLSRSLTDLYRMVTPQDQQEESLLAVTKEEIDTITGYDKKIVPVGKIE